MNLDAVGTEVAIVCMLVSVFILFRYGKGELDKTRTGRLLNRLVIISVVLVLAMYLGARLMGVNP